MLGIIDHGAIREIRLARPPVNALNPELLGAVRDAVLAAPADGVRGLILSGGPKVFSAGLDVPFLVGLDREALHAAWGVFFEAAQALAQSPIPVVAAIGGHSPAGGCVLALCCDYRVMARGPFRIGLNEVEVGLVVPEGIQHLMKRLVGPARAERLMVAGAMVESEQALALGMVDQLAEPDEVAQHAREWLEALLAKPSKAMLATREIARADLRQALTDPQRIRLDHFLDAWFEPETQAVLRAVVARLKGG
jgi:enoyl-CoA hydratase/carnithine racemase